MTDELVPGVTDLEVLARGSGSVVYRGTQPDTKRTVVVKILDATMDDANQRARFERECRSIVSLGSHPNIVTVHDAGLTAEGHPYLVMEYLPESLADLLAERSTLRWQEAVALGTEVAAALTAAHGVGVLHRDVNPGNILLAADDVPKLTNFGLARFAGTPALSDAPRSSGFAHAAPEVVLGKAVDERSDIYSLASTLYETVNGAPAFGATADDEVGAVVDRIVTEPPESLVSRGVPAPVEAVIFAGMAKDPGKRPVTAELFAQQLLAAAKSTGEATGAIARPVAAGPGGAATAEGAATGGLQKRRVSRPSRRWPALVGFAAVAALVIAGLAWAIGRSGGDDTASTTVPVTTVATTVATTPVATIPVPTTLVAAFPFEISFDLAASSATLSGTASAPDAVLLRAALGFLTDVDDELQTSAAASPDRGVTAKSAAALLIAMQTNLVTGTLTYDGDSFLIVGVYRDDDSRAALQAVIDATVVPVARPDLSAAPTTVATPTTSTVPGQFSITRFTSEDSSTTFRIPADGKKHSFTYDVEVAGLTADQYCPVRAGLESTGAGLSDLELGSCFPPDTPPNQLTFRAFGPGTTTFTLWVCNGASRGRTCPGTRSINGVEITVIAEPA